MACLVLVTKDVDLWTLYFVDNFTSYLDDLENLEFGCDVCALNEEKSWE